MKFYFPFVYFWYSRAKTFLHRASFFVLILMPVLVFYWAINNYQITVDIVIAGLLGFIGMFSMYEVGYMYNDVQTTRFEENPKLWLRKRDREFIERKFEMQVASRVVCTTICVLLLRYVYNLDVACYCIMLVLLHWAYAFHNTIRGKWNILTDFALQVLKYCSVLWLFPDKTAALRYSVAMILAVPVLRTVEYSKKESLNIKMFAWIDVNVLRVAYHGVFFVGSLLLASRVAECKVLAIVSLLLLVFRIASFVMLMNKKIFEIRTSNFKEME